MTELKIKKKTLWTILIIVLVSIGFFILNNSGNSSNKNFTFSGEIGSDLGDIAPDFSLSTVEEDVVKLSDFRGKYVLFASMATWCTPCQIEANNVRRAQENLEGSQLVVMQIDVDPRETNNDLEKFRKEFGQDNWIMGFDDGSIAQLYNIRTFDTTLLVNPEGKIIYRDNGFPIDTKTLEDLIVKGESTDLVLGSIHEHANISVMFGGEKVDFSNDQYQLKSSFVHFEDKDGKSVHVHAKGITLRYLFETLRWVVDDDCIVTDFGKYCDAEITVNGEKAGVEHEIKDDEKIKVEYK